jgi:hypothetical protein
VEQQLIDYLRAHGRDMRDHLATQLSTPYADWMPSTWFRCAITNAMIRELASALDACDITVAEIVDADLIEQTCGADFFAIETFV